MVIEYRRQKIRVERDGVNAVLKSSVHQRISQAKR